MINDTIAAIATPHGTGGVAIIRISGEEAFDVANKIIKLSKDKTIYDIKSHNMTYCKIVDKDKILDFGMVCPFISPNSYTGENTVEIYCHGGNSITHTILEVVIKNGARLAEPGEFTKRAFINGKIDLTQAEAVGDLIHSESLYSSRVAANQLEGKLSKKINDIRNNLINISSHLLATLDFSEEGVEDLTDNNLTLNLKTIKDELENLLLTADNGRIINSGANIAIVGTPNVGKSSLLNAFSGEETAIVTNIAGTTRDTIEVSVNINGIKLNVFDTAGIRKTDDIVESIGVERAKNTINKADLILVVLDSSRDLTHEDEKIIDMVKNKKVFYVINKTDISKTSFNFQPMFEISVKDNIGIEQLFESIASTFISEGIEEKVLITNQRQKDAIIRSKLLIENAVNGLENGMPSDIILSDIEDSISALGEITGLTVSEEIIDKIFENFCVGK